MTAEDALRDVARSVTATGHVGGVPGPVVLATAALHDARRASMGFLATSGHYGAQAHFYAPTCLGERRTLMVQLRAVLAGLNYLDIDLPYGTPVEVRLEHLGALEFLTQWARGGTAMPEGYQVWHVSGATSTLERLRQMVARQAAALTFHHAPAQADNILQLAAESLAALGLRSSKGLIASDALPGLTQEYARQDLTAYVRLPVIRPGARLRLEPHS